MDADCLSWWALSPNAPTVSAPLSPAYTYMDAALASQYLLYTDIGAPYIDLLDQKQTKSLVFASLLR
jgi:hypothetical protein